MIKEKNNIIYKKDLLTNSAGAEFVKRSLVYLPDKNKKQLCKKENPLSLKERNTKKNISNKSSSSTDKSIANDSDEEEDDSEPEQVDEPKDKLLCGKCLLKFKK